MESVITRATYELAPGRRPQFWRLAMRCTQIAGTVDVIFFFLFQALGSPVLAWVNVVSVAMYAGAYYALKNHRNKIAVILIWAEVLGHAGLGIVLIGWQSGFHYYLLMFIPAICVSAPRRWAVFALLALWGYYIGLDGLMWYIEPLQPIHQTALHVVHLFNLSVVFAMFSYLASYYLRMVVTAQRNLREMATTDSLTGLFNRRHMTYLAEKEVARFRRSGHPVGLLLLDIDHFKLINDAYGHEAGDRVLRVVADVIRDELRAQDLVGRWGGEEFLVILPDTDSANAQASAERIRNAFLARDWSAVIDRDADVTISIGVSELQAGEDLSAALSRADEALYRGKSGGRNRVELETV
ncbi:sensor domain-containing diguanylate cyclase [Marinobacter sp. F3R08]|uniref:GGDEF domain-containing protein n=1 Tax=Marinobacter sp. F3R08 TaxID=2841559 RepID=UPI001C0829C9|nr:GGDEF domain-containing protein [Marinobacter sp. F3R08]MBU2954196.1 GGDEF domain-containing protein [Marinobacter sp. F3R08]